MSSFFADYPVRGGGGVPIYPTTASFPATATTGSLAVDASTGNLYEFNGTMWVLIAGPAFTTYANTSLSNLTPTAINLDLVPDAADVTSLGSSTFPWLNLYINNIYASPTSSTGQIFDSSANLSIDWQNHRLYDSSGTIRVNWNNGQVKTPSGVTVLQWDAQLLSTASGGNSIDWNARLLYGNGNRSLDYANDYLIDQNNITSVDWNNRLLYDATGNQQLFWSTSGLQVGLNGTTPGMLAIDNGNIGGASVIIQNTSTTSPYNFNLPATPGTTGQVLISGGGGSSPMTWTTLTGTVSSVGFSDNSTTPIYTIGGSPVTSSGTITQTLNTQATNSVFAGPSSGGAAQPTFRALVASDIPSLSGTYVTQSEVGAANGVVPLNSSSKIPVAFLPNSVLQYQSTWNPTTNTPTLQDSTGTAGYVYWVSALFAGPITGLNNASMVNFQIGDLVIYNGTQWELTTPAAGVSSVNGAQGAVTVNAINQLTGGVTAGPASGSASAVATVVSVGGSSAANVNTATVLVTGSQTANTVLAAPNGSSGAPTFRALVAADLPSLTGTYATTTLNNLGTTAINASLIPNTTNSINLGSSSKFYNEAFISGLYDGGATLSIDPVNRQLKDNSGNEAIGWSARQLTFPSTATAIDWSVTGTLKFPSLATAGLLAINASGVVSTTNIPTIGINGSVQGILNLATSTASGASIAVQNGGATTGYNFNLPTTAGTSGQVLTSGGGGSAAMTWTTPITRTAPTIQKFLSGSGTYTTPAGVLYIRVRMTGGGGGGAGAGVSGSPTGGGTGGTTTFGTSLLSATGGVGASAGLAAGGAGGTISLGTTSGQGWVGGTGTGSGGEGGGINTTTSGGDGGTNTFGGAGGGGGGAGAGTAGANNTGAGGGGGSCASSGGLAVYAGAGGGAGGYIDTIITSPSATYAYTVGTSGAGGTGATAGGAGGGGGSGFIIVEEFYQ